MDTLEYTKSGDIAVGSVDHASPTPSTSAGVFSCEFLGLPEEPKAPNGKIFTKRRGRPPSTNATSRRGRPPSTNAASKKRRAKMQGNERREKRLKGGFIISDSEDFTGKEDSSDAEALAMLSVASDSDSGSHDSDASDVFHVESILDDYVQDDGVQRYLIKWKGYDSSENTWEPEDNLNCPAILDNYRKLKNPARRANARAAFRDTLNGVGDGKKPKAQTVLSGVRRGESAARHSGSSDDEDDVPLRNSLLATNEPSLKVKLKATAAATAPPTKLKKKAYLVPKEGAVLEDPAGSVAGHTTTEATEEHGLLSGEEGDGEAEVAHRKATAKSKSKAKAKEGASKSDAKALSSTNDAKALSSRIDSTVVRSKNDSTVVGSKAEPKETANANGLNGLMHHAGPKEAANKNEASSSKKTIAPVSHPIVEFPPPYKGPELKSAIRKLPFYKPISSAPAVPAAPAAAKESAPSATHLSAVSRKQRSVSPRGPGPATPSAHPSADRSASSPGRREPLARLPTATKGVDSRMDSTPTESSDVSAPHDSTPEVDPNAARQERRALLEMRLANRSSSLQAAKKQFQLKQRLANSFRSDVPSTAPQLPGDKVGEGAAGPAFNGSALEGNAGQSSNDMRGSPSTCLPIDRDHPGALNSSFFQDPPPGGNSSRYPGDYVEDAPVLPSNVEGVSGPLNLERLDSPASMRDNSFTPDYAVSPVSDIDYSQVPQVKPYEPPRFLSRDPRVFDPRLGHATYDYAVPLAVRLPLEEYSGQLPSAMWSVPVPQESLSRQMPHEGLPLPLASTSRSTTLEHQAGLSLPGPDSYQDTRSDGADSLSHLMATDAALKTSPKISTRVSPPNQASSLVHNNFTAPLGMPVEEPISVGTSPFLLQMKTPLESDPAPFGGF